MPNLDYKEMRDYFVYKILQCKQNHLCLHVFHKNLLVRGSSLTDFQLLPNVSLSKHFILILEFWFTESFVLRISHIQDSSPVSQ